jgi:hypothetical protein
VPYFPSLLFSSFDHLPSYLIPFFASNIVSVMSVTRLTRIHTLSVMSVTRLTRIHTLDIPAPASR